MAEDIEFQNQLLGERRVSTPHQQRPIIYTSSSLLQDSPPDSPEVRRKSLEPAPLSFDGVTKSPTASQRRRAPTPHSHSPFSGKHASLNKVRHTEIHELKERTKNPEDQVQDLQHSEAQGEATQKKLVKSENDHEELHTAIRRVHHLEMSLKSSQNEIAEWKGKYEELSEECVTLQATLATSSCHSRLLDSAIDSLKADLAVAEATIDRLSAQLTTAIDTEARQAAQIAASSKENSLLAKENRRLETDVALLAQQVQQSTELLHKLTSPLDRQRCAEHAGTDADNDVIAVLGGECALQSLQHNINNNATLREVDQNVPASPTDVKGTSIHAQPAMERTRKQLHSISLQPVECGGEGVPVTESVPSSQDPSHETSGFGGIDSPIGALTVANPTTRPTSNTSDHNDAHADSNIGTALTTGVERQTKNTVQSAQKRVSHFDTAKELMQQTLILEDSLLSLNIERSSLESELARMPCGTSGRTGAQRRRKVEVEQRLAQIAKDIGRVKRELKSIGAL